MRKRVILITIGFFIVAAVVSLYFLAAPVNVSTSRRSPPELHTAEKFQWAKHWDELDLAAVKRKYQPYTLAAMQEMWGEELLAKYGGSEALKREMGKVDVVYPQDTYLARLLELGRAFVDFSDYEHALLNQRIWLFSTRVYWDTLSVAERSAYLERRGVPPDATWNMYEEVLLKNDVVYSINLWRSRADDPYMNTPLPGRF